jgi:hypothetical protein
MVRGSQVRFQSTKNTFLIHSPSGTIHRPSRTSPERFSLGRFSRPPRARTPTSGNCLHVRASPRRFRRPSSWTRACFLPAIPASAPKHRLCYFATTPWAAPAPLLLLCRTCARALALRLLRPRQLRAHQHRRIVQRLGLIQVRPDLHPRVCAPRAPLPACVPNHLRTPLARSAAVDQDRPRALPPSLP